MPGSQKQSPALAAATAGVVCPLQLLLLQKGWAKSIPPFDFIQLAGSSTEASPGQAALEPPALLVLVALASAKDAGQEQLHPPSTTQQPGRWSLAPQDLGGLD